MAQRPPPCRGLLLCQTNPPPNPVCTRKPCLAEPNPSPIRFCTGEPGLAEPNRNHRLAPHNSARPDRCQGTRGTPAGASTRHNSARRTDARASARRSRDQAAPGQTQDTHQDKQRHGKHPPSKPIRTSNARPDGARYTNRNRQPQWRPAISVAEIRNY